MIPQPRCTTRFIDLEFVSFWGLGQFQLVDISARLPGLVRRPGLTKWRVGVDKEGTFFDKYDEFQASLTTDRDRRERGSKIPETLFTPANVAELNLDRR